MPRERVNLRGIVLDGQSSATPHEPTEPAHRPPAGSARASPRSYETPQFAFVPVGLSPANLAWIEDLVSRLRRKGNRQASRSKIIRALIERYGAQLERDLLAPDAHSTIPPSDHAA